MVAHARAGEVLTHRLLGAASVAGQPVIRCCRSVAHSVSRRAAPGDIVGAGTRARQPDRCAVTPNQGARGARDSKQPWPSPDLSKATSSRRSPLAMHRHVLRWLVGVDVDVDVVDVGDAAGETLVGGGGDLVALVDGGGGVDVDGDVGDEAVAEPADFG